MEAMGSNVHAGPVQSARGQAKARASLALGLLALFPMLGLLASGPWLGSGEPAEWALPALAAWLGLATPFLGISAIVCGSAGPEAPGPLRTYAKAGRTIGGVALGIWCFLAVLLLNIVSQDWLLVTRP